MQLRRLAGTDGTTPVRERRRVIRREPAEVSSQGRKQLCSGLTPPLGATMLISPFDFKRGYGCDAVGPL